MSKTFKNSTEASQSYEQDIHNFRRLCAKYAELVSQKVEKKGGLSTSPSVWAYISKIDSDIFGDYIIDSLLNTSEFIRLDHSKYKKADIKIDLLKNATIYKSRNDQSFWKFEQKEVRMGNYQNRFIKIDPLTGTEVNAPTTAPSFIGTLSTTDINQTENSLKKFVDSLFR